MQEEINQQRRQGTGVQFSLATLLALVTVAALVVAAITELPEWIGAPLLAFISTAAAAGVVAAAMRSKGYALTFYVGAAFPLCILVLRTSLVLGALSDGVMQRGEFVMNIGGWMPLYGESFVGQRMSYRWESATVLGCAPLVGLACLGLRWLGDDQHRSRRTLERHLDRRLWRKSLLACLFLLVASLFVFVAIRSVRMLLPPDPTWEAHDGSAVQPSGKTVPVPGDLSPGDPVLVEQNGAWWRGRVKHVAADGNVAIHYVGWESSSDEVVPPSRLQLP